MIIWLRFIVCIRYYLLLIGVIIIPTGSPLAGRYWNDHENDIFSDYPTPTTQEEKEKVERFDPSRLNYTAIRLELEKEVNTLKKREGRFFGGESRFPSIFSNLGRFLDIEQVVNEIETSIMSSVSCNACKAGK